MAGSVGNVLNVADALKHLSGDALRFFILSTHYRSPIDLGVWDWKNPATPIPDGMVETRTAHETFLRFAERVRADHRALVRGLARADSCRPGAEVRTDRVRRVLLPVPRAHGRRLQHRRGRGRAVRISPAGRNTFADEAKLEDPAASNPAAKAEFIEGATLVKEIAQVLGLNFATEAKALGGGDALVAGLMQLLLDLRNNLRADAKEAAKDNPLKKPLFDQTDLIRKRLGELGVTLEDRPGGTTWRVG